MWRSLFIVALLPVAACSTLSNTARSYLTAPNGLQVDDDRVRSLLHRGMADSAMRALANRTSNLSPDDRLLRLLYQASAARYAGRYREAGALFDQAFTVSQDRYTKSVSRTAMSLVVNDYALPYTAGRNERLMLHYSALLAWSSAGDVDAAAVEARRLSALLASFGTPTDDDRATRAMLHTVAAAAFDAAGDRADADVARRNAIALGAPLDSAWTSPPDSMGDVFVVVERGDVAHKVAVGLTVPIFTGDNVSSSGSGFAAERLLADFGALRNGGVWWDDTPTWRFTDTRYGPWRGARASYLLDMSWPVLRRSPLGGMGGVRVVSGEARLEPLVAASISDAMAADYRSDRSAILSRTVTRAVAKYLAARAAEAAVEAAAKDDAGDKKPKKKKGDEARYAGMMARMFTNAATTVLERADTRGWTLLPGQVSVVHMRIPAGTHELLVDAAGTRPLSLSGVVVRGGRTTIVSGRLWSESRQGIGTVLERTATHDAAPQR